LSIRPNLQERGGKGKNRAGNNRAYFFRPQYQAVRAKYSRKKREREGKKGVATVAVVSTKSICRELGVGIKEKKRER